jgi:parvulin-like peptidyl-prolyl isomerase
MPRIISVADAATANAVLAQLKAGSAFDALARQHSVAPSKVAGGELAWLSVKTPVEEGKTQGLPLPVAQAITQLPAGAVSPAAIPVAQRGNTLYVIAKLDAKRPVQVPAFDQAKDLARESRVARGHPERTRHNGQDDGVAAGPLHDVLPARKESFRSRSCAVSGGRGGAG